MRTLLSILALSLQLSAFAANVCIRSDASGTSSGADWINAMTALPTPLVRGNTYFIADGTYANYAVTTVASGTSWIYVKKATQAAHGTDTGWDPSYGDGQAQLGKLSFNAIGGNGGYIDIDGYSAQVANGWGFKIGPLGIQESAITFDSGAGNWPECKFRYIQMAGPMTGTDMASSANPPWSWGFYIFPYNGNPSGAYYSTSNLLVQYCDIRGFGTGIGDSSGNTDAIFEHNNFYDFRVTGADHANVYLAKGSRVAFRYNRCWNYNAEGVYFVGSTTGSSIYGNLFFNGSNSTHGVEMPWDRVHTDLKVYNNTFANLDHSCIYVGDTATTVGVEIYNNLFWNIGYNSMQGIWLSNGGTGVTTRSNVIASSNPFVSSADFRLAAAAPGYALAAPYNTDANGNTRGADGVFDIGAYEYGVPATTNPPAVGVWNVETVRIGTLHIGQ